MPKVGGRNIDQCMSMCMDDPATVAEYPNTADRQRVCYAACSNRFEEENKTIEELIAEYNEATKK